jgi:hypothetical protein
MDTLYLALFITSLAMAAILVLVFFDRRLKKVLTQRTYKRAFTFLSVLVVAGILLAATIGLSTHHDTRQAMMVTTNNYH